MHQVREISQTPLQLARPAGSKGSGAELPSLSMHFDLRAFGASGAVRFHFPVPASGLWFLVSPLNDS